MRGHGDDVRMTDTPTAPEHRLARTEPPREYRGPRLPGETPEVHDSGLSIIASKIGRAVPGRSILSRPRLVDWLLNQGRARLVLVSAEAGYGKTTLLDEFALQTRDTCVWYRMEPSDGDWITFLSYMVAGLRDVWPGFGRPTEALLRNVAAMGSSQEVVLAQFLADLSEVENRRIAVILDDYHFVEKSPDIRMILSRLLERAPSGMYFILGGRGAPNLALGRLLAQGRVSELTIDDLRFTLEEIEQLFANTYGQPLDEAACRTIHERTDGWAASLQLISASIAVSEPSEVASFIEALSGAAGPIYDFLAEEVLTRLSPRTQRILMRASLVDRVDTRYVSAALSADGAEDDAQAVSEALDAAEALGLLGGRTSGSSGRRVHPLFRDFLGAQLRETVSTERIRHMHRAIANAAVTDDWLIAAKHYALARDVDDCMRVLGSAAGEALGTGAWGAAVGILDLLPETVAPPAVKVIKARALISDEQLQAALELMTPIDRADLSPEERALVGLTCAAIHHMRGASAELVAEVEAVASDAATPDRLRDVAISWRQLLDASVGGCISDAVQVLRRIATNQAQAQLHYFAGVTLHNTATAELSRGNYDHAISLANESMAHLERTDVDGTITASTKSIVALASAENGSIEEALRLSNEVATQPGATADAIAEAAHLHAVCGRTRRALSLLAKFERGDALWADNSTSRAAGCYGRAAVHMAQMDYGSAHHELDQLKDLAPVEFDTPSRIAVLEALIAVAEDAPTAALLARNAVHTCSVQHSWRWAARARIIDAAVRRDGEALALWIAEAETESSLAPLEVANAVATAIGTLAPLPEALERSILREPSRWVDALGSQVQGPPSDDASAAASIIARYGTADDVPLLRDFERATSSRRSRKGIASQLVRRVSPTVRVHDLGLSSYEVGDRRVALAETRRKPAALLLYLVTKAGLVATRELVMESLVAGPDTQVGGE